MSGPDRVIEILAMLAELDADSIEEVHAMMPPGPVSYELSMAPLHAKLALQLIRKQKGGV